MQVADTQQECHALQVALQDVTATNREAVRAIRGTPTAAAHLQGLHGTLDSVTRALQATGSQATQAQQVADDLAGEVEAAQCEAEDKQHVVNALRTQQVQSA